MTTLPTLISVPAESMAGQEAFPMLRQADDDAALVAMCRREIMAFSPFRSRTCP
jgi:hypothetical protein